MKKYTLDYKIVFKNNTISILHTMKIKNCMGELHAKVKLETYLKKKEKEFKELIVVSCKESYLDSTPFDSIFNSVFK